MKYFLAAILALSVGCAEQHTSPPPVPVVVATPPSPPNNTPATADEQKKNKTSDEDAKKSPDTSNQEPTAGGAITNSVGVPPAPAPAPAPAPEPVVPAAAGAAATGTKPTDAIPDITTGLNNNNPATVPKDSATKTDPLDTPVTGTPASIAAEKAAFASNGRTGIRPPGSSLSYTSDDEPRIKYYQLFTAGTLDTGGLVRQLFRDPDFNRDVEVLGDLYQQDKLNGSISPDADIKFQELGEKLGKLTLAYNQKRENEFTTQLGKSVVIGTILGAVAGGFLIKDEWVPAVVKTRLGDRIPVWARDVSIGGLVGGTTVLISMYAYHTINNLARPQNVYNPNPLLDTPQ